MKAEKLMALIAILALIYEFLQLPGSGISTFLIFSLISVLYFMAGTYFFSTEAVGKTQQPIFSLIAGITLSTIPFGIMYKVQHWHGVEVLLGIGAISALIIIAVGFHMKSKASEDLLPFYKNMIMRATVMGLLAGLFMVLPGNIFP